MSGNYGILILILFPLLGAVIAYFVGKKKPAIRNDIVDIVLLSMTCTFAYLCYTVISNNNSMTFSWTNFCGFGMNFEIDGFRAIYGLIAVVIWIMAHVFGKEYFKKTKDSNRYYLFNLITLCGTIGVLISSDLFTTFVFFEIMSMASVPWVLERETSSALKAGGTYLAVAIIGGLLVLMGIGIIYAETNTLSFNMLFLMKTEAASSRMWLGGILAVLGFGAKACLFPLHIWLPETYDKAPAPATALLSSILTKTGVFGILVISIYVLGDKDFGMMIFVGGIVTMFVGAFFALFQDNIKKILAYSSMSHIGFVLVGAGLINMLGEDNSLAAGGTFLHMINHTFVKISLFLIAGVIAMNTGKVNLNDIRGYGRKKPVLMIAFLLGGATMAGVPFTSGYVSKTLLHESLLEYIGMVKQGLISGGLNNYDFLKTCEWIFLIAGGCTLAYMVKIFIAVFVEKPAVEVKEDRNNKAQSYMSAACGVAILLPSLLFVLGGILPNIVMDNIANQGMTFMLTIPSKESVRYFSWGNISGALISMAIGAFVYLVIIRGLFMKKDSEGERVYVNRWPAWLNLETCIYRPVLMTILPTVGIFFSSVCDWVIDGPAVLLRRTVFRDNPMAKTTHYGSAFTDALGLFMDNFKGFLNTYVFKKHKFTKSFVQYFARIRARIKITIDLMSKSVSFGLWMFGVGFVFTVVYMLYLVLK